MIEEDDRITPSEAAALVVKAMKSSTDAAQSMLGGWIDEQHLRAIAIEVIRWTDAPSPSILSEAPPLAGPLLTRFEGNLQREVIRNYSFEPVDWQGVARAANSGDADLATLWETAELTLPIAGNWNLSSRAVFSGIRFSRSDVLARLSLIGKPSGATVIQTAPAATAADRLPRLPDARLNAWWSELSTDQKNLPQKDLVELCQAAFPANHISRQRVRDLDPGRKRGPKGYSAA